MKKKHPRMPRMHADTRTAENHLRKSAPSAEEFFPPRPESRPTSYAYEDTNPQYGGFLKVGYGAECRGPSGDILELQAKLMIPTRLKRIHRCTVPPQILVCTTHWQCNFS